MCVGYLDAQLTNIVHLLLPILEDTMKVGCARNFAFFAVFRMQELDVNETKWAVYCEMYRKKRRIFQQNRPINPMDRKVAERRDA